MARERAWFPYHSDMAVGDCEKTFFSAAGQDGIELIRYTKSWLNQQGHFGLPDRAASVKAPLQRIFLALGGDPDEQASKRLISLPGDFIHPPTGTIIEVDEKQHFTSFRLESFDFYPPELSSGYPIEEYKDLCRRFASVADTYRRSKPAVAFGPNGRQRQRAYYDALRDLAAPAMGLPPLIRITAADNDGAAAYLRNRDRIHAAVDGA